MGFGVKQADVAAIKEKTDNLPDDPSSQTTVVSQIQTSHTATDGLVTAVDTVVDAVKVQTDQLGEQVSPMDFWSDVDDVIDLPAVAADTALPDVVVSGLPSGVAIDRVVVLLKARTLENTNAGGTNGIAGAQNIEVRKAAGSWVAAINLADNQWLLAASTRESGDVLIGDNDVKTTVDGDATYNFQFASALVDRASLRLNDVIVGLRFYFSTS